MLSRSAVDVVRLVQMAIGMFGIAFPIFADAQDEAEGVVGAIAALVLVIAEILKRKNVTPVSDPKNNSGMSLSPRSPGNTVPLG